MSLKLNLKNSKIALLTDTHLGARNDNTVFHDYFERFYLDVFFKYLADNQIDTIIHLGDMFDRRKYINYQSLQLARKYFFEQTVIRGITVLAIVGNHDAYFSSTIHINSPRLLLGEYPNIQVFDTCEEVEINGTVLGLVPWICPDNEQETATFLNDTKANVLFGHFEFRGFQMYKGAVIDHGIDPKIVEKFQSVYSGHFHHKSSKYNIHYLGSAYEMTWSDYDDPRGFHVYDTSSDQLTYIENPLKMFAKLFYDDTKPLPGVNQFKHMFIKLVVINKTDPLMFDQYIDALEKVGISDLQVVEDHHHLDTQTDVVVDQSEDTFTVIEHSIDNMKTAISKNDIKTYTRKLYAQALEVE